MNEVRPKTTWSQLFLPGSKPDNLTDILALRMGDILLFMLFLEVYSTHLGELLGDTFRLDLVLYLALKQLQS